jgi:hypothetical protein
VAAPDPSPAPRPPGRALLRAAGVLTQLSCGACLLIGTIGLVLVQQNRIGSLGAIAAWLAVAMAGLVFGGLIYRGGRVSLLIAAAIDAGFGALLIAIDYDTVRQLLRILPSSDVDTIAVGIDAAGFVMLGAAAVCLIALPQGIRYAHWFRGAAATRSAMSTARGFPPPPVPVRTMTLIIPADQRPGPRRRLFLVLGGVAISAGIGAGVLVTQSVPVRPASNGAAAASTPPTPPKIPTARPAPTAAPTPTAATGSGVGSASPSAVASATTTPAATTPEAVDTVRAVQAIDALMVAQRAAIEKADALAFAGLLEPKAFGFGIDADEVAEGAAAVAAQVMHDLGEAPPGGFTVESRAMSIGQDGGQAWIADEIEVGTPGQERRRFAISELAALTGGAWRVVALHWATPVDDATAERLAILNILPTLQPIPPGRGDGSELDRAVRAAFASRVAFADAYSERPDAFNYGSGGERARGGAAIKRIFGRLKAQIRLHDGARVVAAGQWDPAQRTDPRVGWAAVNVDFTSKTRAATDVTQTFRVLAVLFKEGGDWKIVQTQWSNGGPIR